MPQVNEMSWVFQSFAFLLFLFISLCSLMYKHSLNSFYFKSGCLSIFSFSFLI